MNATLDLMARHRSIRRYTADPIPEEDVRRAVVAGQAASTSSAVQAYCLIRVTDVATRQSLVGLTGGQGKVADCGAFFVVAGDVRRHRLAAAQHGVDYEAHLEAFLLAVIDATLFAQNVALAFESMGYGMCYIGGLRNDLAQVDALLELPEGVYPLYGLCVGRPDETPAPRPRLPLDAVLFDDRYPDDATMTRRIVEYDEAYVEYLATRGVEPAKQRSWSALMAAKFSEPRRDDLGVYYRAKGADLR